MDKDKVEKIITEEIPFYDDMLIGGKDKEGNIWLSVNHTCRALGLNEDDSENQVKKIKTTPILQDVFDYKYMKITIQCRKRICIPIKYLSIWLMSINLKTLNEQQYTNVIELLNWSLSEDFDKIKTPTKIYSFESELRDEIYDMGYLLDLTITNKEVIYDFGRVDLEALDMYNNKWCIELKRYNSMNYVKEQLLRYKNSGKFDKIGYCSYTIEDELKSWCEENDITIFIYKRKLQINKINDRQDKLYEELLSDIESLSYGLENYEEIDGVLPTKKQTIQYKNNLIEEFYKYKKLVLKAVQEENYFDFIKKANVLLKLKQDYINAEDADFSEKVLIDEESDLDYLIHDLADFIFGYIKVS